MVGETSVDKPVTDVELRDWARATLMKAMRGDLNQVTEGQQMSAAQFILSLEKQGRGCMCDGGR